MIKYAIAKRRLESLGGDIIPKGAIVEVILPDILISTVVKVICKDITMTPLLKDIYDYITPLNY